MRGLIASSKIHSVKFQHPQFQFVYLDQVPSQVFCEDISNLIFGLLELHDDISFVNIIPQKVISHINILSPFMMEWVLRHIESTCVITQERDNMSNPSKNIKLLFDPHELSTPRCICYILCLSYWKNNWILSFSSPWNERWAQKKWAIS